VNATTSVWAGVISICLTVITIVGGTLWQASRAKVGDERSQELQANAGIASGYSLLTDDLRQELNRLRADVDGLRKDMDAVKRRYSNAVAYIRLLLAFIAEAAPGHAPPQPPKDLDISLD
jgi:hypothetical protein